MAAYVFEERFHRRLGDDYAGVAAAIDVGAAEGGDCDHARATAPRRRRRETRRASHGAAAEDGQIPA
jgi:hypothetical protein